MVAMYALPTREQLLNRVCIDVERSISILPDVLDVSKVVYERTEQLYTDFDLHSLPWIELMDISVLLLHKVDKYVAHIISPLHLLIR